MGERTDSDVVRLVEFEVATGVRAINICFVGVVTALMIFQVLVVENSNRTHLPSLAFQTSLENSIKRFIASSPKADFDEPRSRVILSIRGPRTRCWGGF